LPAELTFSVSYTGNISTTPHRSMGERLVNYEILFPKISGRVKAEKARSDFECRSDPENPSQFISFVFEPVHLEYRLNLNRTEMLRLWERTKQCISEYPE